MDRLREIDKRERSPSSFRDGIAVEGIYPSRCKIGELAGDVRWNFVGGPIGRARPPRGMLCGLLKVSKGPLSRAHRLERSWVVQKKQAWRDAVGERMFERRREREVGGDEMRIERKGERGRTGLVVN